MVPPGESVCQFDESSGVQNAGPRFILLNEVTAEQDYSDVRKAVSKLKAIHWLSKQPGGLEWKKSSGSIDVIRQYLDPDKRKEFTSIADMGRETVVLTGSDGEGKSTYMTNLHRQINITSPATWVIRLNLHEHVSHTDRCDLTEARVADLVASVARLRTPLEAATLWHSLETTKNVAVLVDEMGFRHKDDNLELLRILKDMKLQNLVFATDACVTPATENALSVLAFTLKPLAREELQMWMTKLWETNAKQTDDRFGDGLPTALPNVTGKFSVMGKSPTPLDIKIAADAFEKDHATSLTSKVNDLPQCSGVAELYKKYIKRAIEMRRHSGAGSDKDWAAYRNDVTHCAMLSVFAEETVKQFVSLEESASEVRDQFGFLHRSLKHYVIAKWFAENYQTHRSFMRGNYFAVELQPMWLMSDRLLAARCDLRTSVLDGDAQTVSSLLCGGCDVNTVDTGGRTALHLAAIQTRHFAEGDPECAEIASLLIDHGADVSTAETVLQWTAMRYADKIGSCSMIDRLLAAGADRRDVACTGQQLLNRTSLQGLASNAAANGLKHLTGHILSTGLDINSPLHCTKHPHQRYGLAHIASQHGHVSLLEFLLERNGDVNVRNWDGSTPLHLACRQGNKHCACILPDGQARVNQSNRHGDTALHVACHSNNVTAVRLLMDRKAADTYTRNRNDLSPLDCAILGGGATRHW
jgi:ankyrin repeat protein/energy-coupling factor transporter ATP-binding protein EcfA2